MRIPRHWASAEAREATPKGGTALLKCFGWSDEGVPEARGRAMETLARLSARMRNGEPFPEKYVYAERPIREEILEQLADADGRLQAVVTRNAYGSRILNTAGVMFVDVDIDPDPAVGLMGALGGWFKRRKPEAETGSSPPPRATEFVRAHPDWRIRVYRTFAGWRYLVTHAVFDPASDETRSALEALDCDPKYVQLTRVQECFRARLTAKPWRCGVERPVRAFPREKPETQRAFEAWLGRYEPASARFAACRLVATLGGGRDSRETAAVVEWHDRNTRAKSDLPLA